MIAIIDYDAGNLRSVEKALISLGEDVVVSREADVLLAADKVILPGVGAFGDAMNKLKEYGLVEVINKIVAKNIPLLGICLGLQLMFEESDEAPGVKGLGLIKGKILRIPPKEGLKIPHMGWNSIDIKPQARLFKGIKNNSYVYVADEEDIVAASTEYSVHIHATVESGNIFACQFHPEKSSDIGLKILKNFAEL